jgi:hypothetical protein
VLRQGAKAQDRHDENVGPFAQHSHPMTARARPVHK